MIAIAVVDSFISLEEILCDSVLGEFIYYYMAYYVLVLHLYYNDYYYYNYYINIIYMYCIIVGRSSKASEESLSSPADRPVAPPRKYRSMESLTSSTTSAASDKQSVTQTDSK